jgi:hypothetical protein
VNGHPADHLVVPWHTCGMQLAALHAVEVFVASKQYVLHFRH